MRTPQIVGRIPKKPEASPPCTYPSGLRPPPEVEAGFVGNYDPQQRKSDCDLGASDETIRKMKENAAGLNKLP